MYEESAHARGDASLKKRWFRNSAVNLFGAAGTAAVNLLLPAVVAKYLTRDSFSVWSLALQIIVYVNLLNVGLQTATARAISFAGDAGSIGEQQMPSIARASRSIARLSAVAALLIVGALVFGYPMIFPGVPADTLGSFRTVLLLFGLAAATQLLAQADMGVFQGLHRYSIFVAGKLLTSFTAVLLVWFGVLGHQTMVVLAALMAAGMALLWPSMRVMFVRSVSWAGAISTTVIDKARRRELLHYCGALSAMSVSVLVVNSVGLLLVGRLDFHMTGAYAIAMVAATIPAGLVGTALTPLVTTAAAMYAQPLTRPRIPLLLLRSTFIVAVGLNLFFVAVVILHAEILSLWVGIGFVRSGSALMVTLVGTQCLRNIATPYSVLLIAGGRYKRAFYTAVFEAAINLVASIVLGIHYGALGVAMGTLIGALVGVIGAFLFNTMNTPELTPHAVGFIVKGFVLPLVLFAPLQAYVLWIFM